MENGHESGYSLPPDEIPKTSTPERPGEKMALSEHFLYEDDVYFDATIGFSGDIHLETTGSTAFLSSKMIHTKTDDMMKTIDERLAELENTVGVDNNDLKKIDIEKIKKKLVQKGCNVALRVQTKKLLKLKEVLEKPDNHPLTDKLQFIRCCADVNKQRAALLQDFESSLKIVLNLKDLTQIDAYEEQLEPIRKDVEAALKVWKENTVKIEDFRNEYLAVASSLQECIQNLAEQVERLEHQKKASNYHESEEFFDA